MREFVQVDSEFIDEQNLIIKKPRRSTEYSAGYDFYAPKTYEIKPGQSAIIPTYIKAYMEKDEVLLIAPRSSFGYNYDMVIKSTIGVIDADYADNEKNDGNIIIGVKNNSCKVLTIEAGKHFAQGIFMKYLTTDSDHEYPKKERRGGIGSTNV